MNDIFVCPNCGNEVVVQPAQASVTCNHCREILAVLAEQRIVLANPLRTYLPSDASVEQDEHQRLHFSVAARPPLSPERKKKTAQLAYERMTRQEQVDRSGLVYGIFAIVFGGFLSSLCWFRTEYIQNDWVGWVGLWIGAGVFALGLLVTFWFLRSIRSAQAIKREIEKDM